MPQSLKYILIAIATVGILASLLITYSQSTQHDTEAKEAFQAYQKQIVQSHKPVILHFTMEGCGPCKAFEPAWQAAMTKHQQQCNFETITLEGPDPHKLKRYFDVESFPTLIYIDSDGNYKGRDIGLIAQPDFEKQVLSLIVGDPLNCNSR